MRGNKGGCGGEKEMETEKRRSELLNLLRRSSAPLTGTELAAHFNVSRQVIVQDIAILRASGEQIFASLQGYLIPSQLQERRQQAVVACRHTRKRSKMSWVSSWIWGKILDVIVDHPVYGELRGNLMVASRRDLSLFMESLNKTAAHPLLTLTDGVHLHTLEAPDKRVMDEIIAGLEKAGYLVK